MDIYNIPDLFEKYATKYPEHIAALDGKKKLTYGALNSRATQLAHYLQEKGIGKDIPVALCLPRSFDYLIAIIAVLKAGAAYLPLDSSQPKERLLFQLNDSKAPLLITLSTVKDIFIPYQGELILLDKDKEQINQQTKEMLYTSPAQEDLAYIIYTSGSTGTPKGVLIEHRSVINYCQWFAEYTGCQAQQRIDFSSNPIFDMAISVSLIPLMLGLCIVICEDHIKKSPAHYLKFLNQYSINIMKNTPSYFKILLLETHNNCTPLPELKTIILGGEHLSAPECRGWLARYPEHIIYNEYGPTEATVAMLMYKVCTTTLSDFEMNVPIGMPGPNMSSMILDADHNPVPDEIAGELLIGGVCLARGYLNRPELTAQLFIQDPTKNEPSSRVYRTGDLCKKRSDGMIEYLGRIDDQVKIRGFRIEPREIEKHITSHPEIKTSTVIAQKNVFDEQRLIAYYILKEPSSTLNTDELRTFLQHLIPEYMIPTAFIKIDCLPLTANGKLDKSSLPVPQLESSQHYKAPVSRLEKKLAHMWSEELGIHTIGLNDDFFELGGHSLSVARLVTQINHELEKNLSIHDFYQAPCIAQLIVQLKKTKKIKKEKSTTRTNEYKEAKNSPLSDFQLLLWLADAFEPKAKKLNIIARKRVQGPLNIKILKSAFESVIKKHETLIYRVLKFKPEQQVQKHYSFKLIEKNLETLSENESEQELNTSMEKLSKFHRWPKNAPLLMAKIFYLTEGAIELQMCMPHLISDDASMDILFADLSELYLLHLNQQNFNRIETDIQYKKYVFEEQKFIETTLEQNIKFWGNYLHDCSFFTFPTHYIVKDMNAAKLPYSTHKIIPQHALNKLTNFCKSNHITLNNGLCTLMTLALHNCCGYEEGKSPFNLINIIKSTRDDPAYDRSIGCFLRVEPIKIAFNKNTTVEDVSKQIRESTIETSNYQQCSNLIKVSSISTLRIKKNKMLHWLIQLLTPIGTKILQISPTYRKILQESIAGLMLFKRTNQFMINLNVRNNFNSKGHEESTLFGLKRKAIKKHSDDLLAIDYVFEACFLYEDNEKEHYLVISANLLPEFRTQIAEEIIRIMESELDDQEIIEEANFLGTE